MCRRVDVVQRIHRLFAPTTTRIGFMYTGLVYKSAGTRNCQLMKTDLFVPVSNAQNEKLSRSARFARQLPDIAILFYIFTVRLQLKRHMTKSLWNLTRYHMDETFDFITVN